MKESTVHPTFVDVAIPRAGILRDVVLVAGFACLTAAFAQISFWIGPVPVTGQTFAVLLAGALLGAKRGALSQLSYLAVGATGIPYWFALGGPPGMARLVGPTGGYLLGFVVAAFFVGWLAERGWDRNVPRTAAAMLVGNVAIYIFGLPWLAYFVPAEAVLQVGLYPFIVGDLVKITAGALVLPSGWMLLHRFKG